MAQINKNETRQKRHTRVRKRVQGTTERPRLNIYRSTNNIYAQIIDDSTGVTLAAASTLELGQKTKLNQDNSKAVGKKVAEKALASGIETIVFDRNGYLYHGNIKALAEGAREGGLKF